MLEHARMDGRMDENVSRDLMEERMKILVEN